MQWTDFLLNRAREAQRAEPAKRSPAPVPRPAPRAIAQQAKDIKTVWVQTARPRDGDAGAAEPGWYSVADGVVTMHDENGKATGKSCPIGTELPHVIAHRLAREAWLANRGEGDFNRRIDYPRGNFA